MNGLLLALALAAAALVFQLIVRQSVDVFGAALATAATAQRAFEDLEPTETAHLFAQGGTFDMGDLEMLHRVVTTSDYHPGRFDVNSFEHTFGELFSRFAELLSDTQQVVHATFQAATTRARTTGQQADFDFVATAADSAARMDRFVISASHVYEQFRNEVILYVDALDLWRQIRSDLRRASVPAVVVVGALIVAAAAMADVPHYGQNLYFNLSVAGVLIALTAATIGRLAWRLVRITQIF
ncbi:MAG: hypothetical protein V3R95_07370 [Dehalococcoidia bacterium]